MKATQRIILGTIIAVLIAATGLFLIAGFAATPVDGNAALGRQALENLSPFEQRVLKDKQVTDAEFDESTHVFTECLTEAGIKFEITPGRAGMGSVLMYGTGSPNNSYDEKMQHCVDQVDAVENVWILQNPDNASGAKPLPGLAQALAALDTSG